MDENKIIGNFDDPLKIIPINEIPKSLIPLPDDDEVLYTVSSRMQRLCDQENGIGLSAVQVGIPWSLFIIKFNEEYRTFLNCLYSATKHSKRITFTEGCLSIKHPSGALRYFKVPRYDKVLVKGYELIKNQDKLIRQKIKIEPKDDYNIVFQHEIDHNFFRLIVDFGEEVIF